MKTIELKNGQDWACNNECRGLFDRRPDGTWRQHVGTCDTPYFRTPQQLSRYVHERYRDNIGGSLPRMVGSSGWTE